jgi:hypothetical protein
MWARFLTRREKHLERNTERYNFDKDDLMRFVLDLLRICNLTTTDLDMNAKAVSFLATHLSPESEEKRQESTSKYCYYLDLFLQGFLTPPETMLFVHELPLGRMTPLLRWPERNDLPPVIPLYYELTTREELVIHHAMETYWNNKMFQISTFNK